MLEYNHYRQTLFDPSNLKNYNKNQIAKIGGD